MTDEPLTQPGATTLDEGVEPDRKPTPEEIEEFMSRMAPPIDDLADTEIELLATEWVTGARFVSFDLEEIQMCFMVMALTIMEPGGMLKLPRNFAGATEHMSKANEMAVNGMPTFFSCKILTDGDMPRICMKAAEVDQRLRPERYNPDGTVKP